MIVYCAAAQGEYAYALLSEYGIPITCFCDNDSQKAGIKVLDVPVFTYEECKENYPKSLYIVANIEYFKAALIGKQLEQDV